MIINHHELKDIRNNTSQKTLALTVGCFDIVHEGHLEQLKFAADQADLLAVAVMSDEYVKKRKGPSRPINNQDYRVENIDGASMVDFSFVAPTSSFALAKTMLHLRPDVFVEHEEHEAERTHLIKSFILGALAVRMVANKDVKINSTTNMIRQFGREGALERSLRLHDMAGPNTNATLASVLINID